MQLRPALALLTLTLAGCTSGSTVFVDLRTNLHPGIEFTSAVTELYPGGGGAALDLPQSVSPPATLTLDTGALRGVRVAQFEDILPGTYVVRVILFDGDDEVGYGLVQVSVTGSRIVPVVVHRECGGVECPADGSPTAIACLGGRCVDPSCLEDPSACPEPECVRDDECSANGPECVRGVCLGHYCVDYPDDDRCGPDSYCDVSEGCAAMSVDAGVDAGAPRDAGADAGADGGADAGFDSGTDAGSDAGFDAGNDAGFDAGFDAGPRCTNVFTTSVNISFPRISSSFRTWSAVNATGATTGQTPYYWQEIYCNQRAAPYSFTLRHTMHPTAPSMPNPTFWGYRGTAASGTPVYVTTGLDNTTPSVTLMPGEFFTVIVGGTATGDTGWMAANYRPD